MIQEFYYGSSWHWPLPLLPRVMLSYNFIRTLKNPWKIDIPFMLDSGAFSVIQKYRGYPFGPCDYAMAIQEWKPDVAWTMDYPCEPSIRKKGLYSPREAQEFTIINQDVLLELGVQTQMVVQGWTVADYLENLDKIKDAGLLTERLGIGSICRRGQTQEILRVIKAIHNNVPGWVKLHGFGVKINILRGEGRFLLYSADSTSWAYSWMKFTRNQRTQKEKTVGLHKYINAIEPLLGAPEPIFAYEVA